jgi:glutamate formiminotransferase
MAFLLWFEVVGLTPLEAIVQVADYYLGLENFSDGPNS